MNPGNSSVIIQQYLEDLRRLDRTRDQTIRSLLGRAVRRLLALGGHILHRDFPTLAYPPSNLQVEELLSGVVERLMKALEEVRPETVRHFFALASQHIRWELLNLKRRLDQSPALLNLPEELAAPTDESGSSGGAAAFASSRPLVICPRRSARCSSW